MSSWSRRGAAAFLVAVGVAVGVCAQPEPTRAESIWDGVFAAEQVSRGRAAYTGPCDRCHGYKLDGASDDPDMLPAPPVAGAKFLREWNGRSLAALVEYVRTTMPKNNPGYLSDGDIVDIVAYMLSVSGVPAGDAVSQMGADTLGTIVIAPRPE